jgi:predicted alpha/beta hydrolase family esterase
MQSVVFAHGKPPRERYENPDLPKPHEANWFPWAAKQLEQKGIAAAVPALPRPYHPVFADWKESFPVHDVGRDTGLVGFSAGAEFLLRLFSEDPDIEAEPLILVAPWRDVDGKYDDFSKYTLDPSIGERVGRLTLISSRDDSEVIQANARAIASTIRGAKLLELDGYGHFMLGNNMTSEAFPELIRELLEK